MCGRSFIHLFSLDQDRNHSTSVQVERPVTQDPQDGRYLTRVRGYRYKEIVLFRRLENLP